MNVFGITLPVELLWVLAVVVVVGVVAFIAKGLIDELRK